MPRHELLSPSQREIILALPQANEARLIARFYTFSPHDLKIIGKQRGTANRLGYAVLLAYLRYPGTRWSPSDGIPDHLLTYMADQLDISPDRLTAYSEGREKTRRDQLHRIQEEFAYQPFSSEEHSLHDWLLPFALSTSNPYALVEESIRELRMRRIILPALSTIEAHCWEVYQTAQEQLFTILTENLTVAQKNMLNTVLGKHEEDGTLTTLGWLRQPPSRATPNNFLTIIRRLRTIQEIELPDQLRHEIHPNRLMELYQEGKRFSAWRLGQFADNRRTFSTLVAFLLEQHMHLTDQALLMHTKLTQETMTRGGNRQKRQFQKDGRVINRKLRQYVSVGKALIQANQDQIDPYEALQAVISWDEFVQSIVEVEELTRPASFDHLDEVGHHYKKVRRYSRVLWRSFEFEGDENTEPLRQAISLLRTLDGEGRSEVPNHAPLAFVNSKWRRVVLKKKGGIDRAYYELCTLKELSDRLQAGDIWVASSKRYRTIDDYLIPKDNWRRMKDTGHIPLTVETDFARYIAQRKALLNERLMLIDHLLSEDAIPDAQLKDGKLHFKNSKDNPPEDQKDITRLIYG